MRTVPQRAPAFANALAALSLASLIVGVAYAVSTSSTSDAVAAGSPLLWAAEALKLLSAGALAGLATSLPAGRCSRIVGLTSAVALGMAGAAGLAALSLGRAEFASTVTPLALTALAGTGVWTSLALPTIDRAHGRTRVLGVAYALVALTAWSASPVALGAAILGIAWWRALARAIADSPHMD